MTGEAALKRRDLLKLGARKAVEITSRRAALKAAREAENWIRPPFAIEELDFLLACTRCDKCIEACPPGVLFKLPAKWGIKAADTPAMDLRVRGCHLCADWPCVAACEPEALKFPARENGVDEETPTVPPELPKLALVTIDTRTCLPYQGPECGACAGSCPVPGALQWQGPKPVIDQDACTGCALCREACIVDPSAIDVSALIAGEESAAAQ
jgi:ferredoxin-type protein NapG